MKNCKYIFILFLLNAGGFFSSFYGAGKVLAQNSSNPSNDLNLSIRYMPNNAFNVGEKLTFSVGFAGIVAGTATMEVTDVIMYNERECYNFLSRANSNSFFSAIYPVDNRIESIVDAKGMFSYKIIKKIREGKYKRDREFLVNYEGGWVKMNGDTLKVDRFIQDALSSFYYVRTLDLKVGESYFVPCYDSGKIFDLEVRVYETEKVKVDAGIFDTIVIEPLLNSEGIFKKKGRLKIWVTNDEQKIPVKMASKVFIGSITAKLIKIEGIPKFSYRN